MLMLFELLDLIQPVMFTNQDGLLMQMSCWGEAACSPLQKWLLKTWQQATPLERLVQVQLLREA